MAEDDDSIVDQVEATVVTEQVGCYEETDKRDGYSDGGFAASETREKSCGVEIKEARVWALDTWRPRAGC